MSNILPTVRHFIVCEDIRRDPASPRKVSLINLLSAINSVERPHFPLLFREVCIFAQLTECRGPANLYLSITHVDSDTPIYDGRAEPWLVNLPRDPLEIVGLPFRIRDIRFPYPGLYEVEL